VKGGANQFLRPAVLALLLGQDGQVVERERFSRAISELTPNGQGRLVPALRLAELPLKLVDQPEVVEVRRLAGAVVEGAAHRQSALQVVDRFGIAPEPGGDDAKIGEGRADAAHGPAIDCRLQRLTERRFSLAVLPGPLEDLAEVVQAAR